MRGEERRGEERRGEERRDEVEERGREVSVLGGCVIGPFNVGLRTQWHKCILSRPGQKLALQKTSHIGRTEYNP